jgi:nucleoside-diphosphate-sugar epimerase
MGEKVFVTGGTGFVGSFVVEELLKRGFEVYCLVRDPNHIKWLKEYDVHLVEGSLSGDFTLPENLTYIVHVAGVTKASSYDEYFRGNVSTTENLLTKIQAYRGNIRKIVGISSQAAAGPAKDMTPITENEPPAPITWYGKSKLIAEQKMREFSDKIPVTIIRPPAVYGPRDKDILNVFKFMKWGLNLKIGRAEQYVSLIYVKNLAYGIVEAMIHPDTDNEVFFLTDGKNLAWSEVIDMLAKIMHKKYITLTLPFPVASIISTAIETITRMTGTVSILNRQKMLEVREKFWLCSSEKASGMFGYTPLFETYHGLEETYHWYKNQNWL